MVYNDFMKIILIGNIRFVLFLLLSAFSFSSCITNHDLEYIRSGNEINKAKANKQEYRLQVGDLISVQISTPTQQQHDFFNKEQTATSQLMNENPYLYGYLIKEDGFLDLPSLDRVMAEGFTLRELENVIQQIAISYFEKPVVKLNIINFEISVLGEVNDPGTYKVVHPNVNILYVLSLASDITQFGNRKKVKVIRNDKNTNRVFYIDLTKKETLNNPDFMLQPHDIIYVAPVRKKFYAFNNITNVVSLALSTITLFLLLNN